MCCYCTSDRGSGAVAPITCLGSRYAGKGTRTIREKSHQKSAHPCCDLNLPSVTGAILPNGPYDVVTFALDHWLKAMKEDLSEFTTMDEDDENLLTFNDLSTREKLRVGVKTRLELMAPYVDVWP